MTPFAGVDVVSVTGEFDLRYESLLRHLVTDPARVTQSQVILDLAGVTFMDATGVDAIVYCKRVLVERAADLSVVCPEGQALRVLGLLGLERVLPIYPDRESALRQFSHSRHPLDGTRN